MTETMAATHKRLARYVREYAEQVWPDLDVPTPTTRDLQIMEVRSDGWADAHVGGSHGTEDNPCSASTAQECGERMAAAEFVECG